MAGGPRPRQPRFGGTSGSSSTQRGREQEPVETAGGAESPSSAGAETPRVRVNSRDKVAALDEQRESEFEPVPTGGGRFSDWRRTLQLGSSRSGSRGSARDGHDGDDSRRLSPALRRLVRLAVAVLIVVLIVWGVFFSPLFSVRSLQVEGLSLTDQGAAEEALQPLEGKSMTRISSEEVESLLTQFPAVASVDTSASGSGTLRVEVQERIPVAAVEDGAGWQLVDREGTQLEQLTDSEQIQVPVIAGGTDVLGSEDWDTVGSVLASLPSSLLEQVQTARAESGGVVMLELQDGVTVRWGDDTDSALKAEVLAELVAASEATGAVEVYDVSAPRHPVLE
ncbi:cell division protein FtsQ/DivIB [Kocuria palustris]|uniref:cell division protein FtsQ/DivIB n=1 Tax=Kocuria palustris TaxID=71999 RepID=UPI0020444A85|nr:cell division protein FtsQ/DivIB [Kocuria palustris]MCM3332496.1 cell division protein FtsQ/DivIB [Kocuria palustris]